MRSNGRPSLRRSTRACFTIRTAPTTGPHAPVLIEAVGAAAGLCSMASFAPQLVKIWREKHAQGVSLRAYFVMLAGFSLWVGYGLLLHSWPITVSNAVNLAMAAAILSLKFRYRERQVLTSRNAMPMATAIRPAARKKGAPTRP